MDYDCVLSLLPPFTSLTPSSAIASLHTYLSENKFNISSFDFSPGFHRKYSDDFQISNPFDFKISPFSLLGYTLWYYEAEKFFQIKNIGPFLLKSLCPVQSQLYRPIIETLMPKIPKFYTILDKYITILSDLDTTTYGFSINITNAIATLRVIRRLKELKPDSIIILGGPEVYCAYRFNLYSQLDFIDYVIYHSDGELPLNQLLKYLNDNTSLQNCPGIAYKRNNMVYSNSFPISQQSIKFNDTNPLNYDQINYIDSDFKNFTKLELLISKGCLEQCVFCNEPFIWRFYSKTKEQLLNEINFYVNTFGINKFEVSDNAFNNTNILLKTLESLKEQNCQITFGGNCKLENLTPKLLQTYKNHGLTHCFYGLESGSQKILELMKKRIDLQKAAELIKTTSDLGIDAFLYLIIGFPYETEQDFEQTLEFLKNNKQYITDIIVSVFVLMNNSPIFDSSFLQPLQLGPDILNAFTYKTNDNITHTIRSERFLKIKAYWQSLLNINKNKTKSPINN